MARRGDLYWVDFGVPRGSEQGGRRPALVIQNDTGNASSPTTIIAAITSRKKHSYPFHVEISAAESGLPKDSIVLLEQLVTVNQSRLIGYIGTLPDPTMDAVNAAIEFSLGL